MNEKKTSPFNPTSKVEYSFLCLILLYMGFHGYVNYLHNPNENGIGYMDYVAWSRPLHDLLQGKVFFKDFFYAYGPLFALFQVPFYYLFGANHYGLLVNVYIIMPLLSLFLAHLYIRTFIKIPFLRLLFLFVCLSHYSIGIYPSSRALCAELTLALFFFCLTQPDKKLWIFFTGITQGVSILMGPEYGIAVFITIFTTFTLFSITSNKTNAKTLAKFFLFGLLTALTPFILWMTYHGALTGFLKNYYFFITGFNTMDHAGRSGIFPPFPGVSFSNTAESLNHLLLSQAFRFYLPILLYGIAGLVFIIRFCRGQNPASFKFFLLAFFGLLVFFRVWTSPTYYLLAYGLVPAITLGFLFLEALWLRSTYHYKNYNWETGYNLKNLLGASTYSTILLFTFTWFFLIVENKFLFTFNPGKKKSTDMVYYEKVGFEISREAYDQYTEINNFIEQNVRPDEYILTYPFGYYSRFTGRNYALTSYDASYGLISKRDTQYALNQLNERKPPFVILNTLNSSTTIGAVRGDTPNQISWRTNNSPLFAGNGNPIKIYILENYHLHKKFKIASILKRNKEKKPFNRTFKITDINTKNIKQNSYYGTKPTNENGIWEISNRKARIEYILDKPQYATHIELKYSIHPKSVFKKPFVRSFLQLGMIDVNIEKNLVGCCTKNNSFLKTLFGWIEYFNSKGITRTEKIIGSPSVNDVADLNHVKVKLEGTHIPQKSSLKKIASIWIELKTPKPYLLPKTLHIVSLKLLLDARIKLD